KTRAKAKRPPKARPRASSSAAGPDSAAPLLGGLRNPRSWHGAMQLVVDAARIVLMATALVCLLLSVLYASDAVRALIAHTRLRRGDYAGAVGIYQKLLSHAWQPYAKRRAIAYNA